MVGVMRRTATALTFATLTITALALTACTGEGVDKPATVAIEVLQAPASMSPTQPYALAGSTILPATEDLPWLIVADISPPGGAAIATALTSTDTLQWDSTKVTSDLDGSFSSTLAGDDSLAAIGGTLWTEGSYVSTLFTSTDRTTWTQVTLPEDFATQYSLGSLSVRDEVVHAIGTDSLGASVGVTIDGTDVKTFALPGVGDGELLNTVDLVAGDSLLLIARPGEEGANNPVVAYVSDDAGATWGDAAEIAPADAAVAGAVLVDDGFVATGWAPRSADPGAASIPAAWFSADGASWAAESVPAVGDGLFFYLDNASVGFGAPNVNAGTVSATAWNDNSAASGLFRRAPGGAWTYVSESTVNSGNGVGGNSIPVDDTSTLAVIGQSGYARISVIQPENGWIDTEVLAERDDFDFVDAIYPGEERTVMTLGTNTFEVEADGGWRNSTQYSLATVDDTTVETIPWEPERAGRLTGVQLASNPDGGEILVGANFAPGSSSILAEGWFRASADDEWTPIAGFEGSGATHFVGAAFAGGTWLAWGDYRDTSAVSDPSHALVWQSTDGEKWTRAAGDFGSGALETQMNDICELPGGDAVGVGWIEEAGGEFRTAIWMLEGESWTRVDIGELGESYGYASSCATGEDGVVVGAYFGGRSTLQLSTDGSDWTEVFRAAPGIDFGKPVAVAGGYAASGQLVDGNYSTPVVWLSADGAAWAPVSIPSSLPGSTTAVAPLGDDLVVTKSGRIGDPAVLVRDIATVIEQNK
ncbi:hypothetical protein BH10ACT7_BH10ACT7_14180 [soil metagenome]